MRFLTHALLFLTTSTLLTSTLAERAECGSYASSDKIDAAEKAIKEHAPPRQGRAELKNYIFDVYFNVIASNMTLLGGWVPQKQIDDQMDLLNKAYVGTGISWNLVNVTHVISRYWHETVTLGEPQAIQMARAFRKGKSTAFNVYTVGFYTEALNGYSAFPVDYRSDPYEDGCVLLFETLPGGVSKARQGGTLIHEAGHWLGLYHTFQGGCLGLGDRVDDTPPSAEATYDCPTFVDSCPGGGPDPINNYMDYTNDTCRTEFTPGQIERIQSSMATWRSDPTI
ncbi:hypothetical protein CVT25_002187 [Psilocybe cyanescens]|uniref:Peptidase M43 pregnancy-associated plasma-A domain-containing protein n=1 Tax=Psilocybe cyanescens TaxID=93625 RepID=A0A409XFA2_PSICY|nr:hypothetical protein CVT25_002187 [Psilocybe cyanescens]